MTDPDKIAFLRENRAAFDRLEAQNNAVYRELLRASGLGTAMTGR